MIRLLVMNLTPSKATVIGLLIAISKTQLKSLEAAILPALLLPVKTHLPVKSTTPKSLKAFDEK